MRKDGIKGRNRGNVMGVVVGVVEKALWFIETNLNNPISLAALSHAVCVSRFHMVRSFTSLTGQPVMRYIWRRRLSRAADELVTSQTSIITIALAAGYASPEAFSRAFRAEFGLSPRSLRAKGVLDGLILTQPMELKPIMDRILTAPKIEQMKSMHFAGPVVCYDMETRGRIPAQWEAYNVTGVRAPALEPQRYYGTIANVSETGETFDYLCGQQVLAATHLPAGFQRFTLPAGSWARFATKGHISTMSAVWSEVINHWMTQPDYRPRKGASVEYYPPEFDGVTGNGGFEVWLPIEG